MADPSADWVRIKEIVADALELDLVDRSRYVADRCGEDGALLARVRKLLDASADVGGILDRPLVHGLDPVAVEARATLIGSSVGRYRVRRLIAEGGMGVVYEALQEQPQRRVALKLIRAPFLSAAARRRFRREVEILGRLHHPAVAQVYEAEIHADASGSALPYFAMEYVEGCSLTEHVEKRRLSRERRLELIADICDGVQHAHQRGVIHCDLKPSNVLVDDEGRPKILDFGIARTIGPDTQLTAQTSSGELFGTLAYMSPEQVLGDPAGIDTRTDVYALGVILYQLLAGRLPLPLDGKSMVDSLRTIEEVDPEPLGAIVPSLRGDLETIVGKALSKEKERRYASASELAADLRHHLRHEPISARPPTTVYQIRLFARRHRGPVAALAAFLVALMAGVIVSSIGFMRAADERDRARALNDYLGKMVGAAAPGILGRQAGATELLEFYARDVDTAFAGDPMTRAELHSIIGWTWFGLGDLAAAEAQLRAATSLYADELGESARETTDARTRWANVLLHLDRIEDAERLTARSLTVSAQQLGEEHPSLLAARDVQASLTHVRGDLDSAERQFRELVRSCREVIGPEAELTLTAMGHLSVLLLDRMKYEEASSLIEESLDVLSRSHGSDHPSVLTMRANLAQALAGLGRLDEADALLAEVIAIGERVWGPEHVALISARASRASLLASLGRPDEALPLSEKVLADRVRLLGESHEETISALNNHCSLLLRLGRTEEALGLGRRAVALLEQTRGPDHPHTWTARLNLASALHDSGELESALELMQDVLERRRQVLGGDHPATLLLENNLGMLLLDLDRAPEAAELLRHVLDRTLADGARADPRTVVFRRNLGRCLTAIGEFAEAEAQLLESHRLAGQQAVDVAAQQRRTAEFLVELYEAWGREDEAARWR
ncbi:MAG: serine/threonine protein kinase [Planctomycetes bacterium]|nr:serine/threonine protein kinase [Planctomycetota bacterium]